jgi:hypothetical protein
MKDDGSVDLAVKNCGYEKISPGVMKLGDPASCNSEDKHTGKLVLKPNEIGIEQPDGTTYLYSAYLDKAGKLHAGVGGADKVVIPLGPDKKGDIETGMFVTINIGDKGCTMKDKMDKDETPKPTACRWEDKDGKTLFIWSRPDRFEKDKTEEVGMVYLKDEGLLVRGDIEQMVYEKQP